MDRRRFLAVSLGAGLAGAGLAGTLGGCGTAGRGPDGEGTGPGTGGATSAGPTTTIRLGDTVDASNPEVAAERYFGERLAELTARRYRVEVFPNGTLGDHNRMNEQVRAGSLHMTKTLAANLTAFDRRLGVLSLPYAFASQAELFSALDGDLGRQIGKILDGHNLVLLAFFDAGARNIYNRKRPIRTPADLRGLRLRVPQDAVAIDTFNTLGALATPLATNEITSALQQGTVDGAENNVVFYVSSKHVDEARYLSQTRHQFGVDVLLVSKKFFSDLPAADRDAFVEAGRRTVVHERELWKAETNRHAALAAQRGAQVNDDVDTPAFQQALKSIFSKNRITFGELARFVPLG